MLREIVSRNESIMVLTPSEWDLLLTYRPWSEWYKPSYDKPIGPLIPIGSIFGVKLYVECE